jgi:adenine phosphoribosyltransferase
VDAASPALSAAIKAHIRTVPDYPKQGILFRDITGLLENAEGLRLAIDAIVERYEGRTIDLVAGIEARGFIFGAAVAYRLGVGFIPVRKAGKLPGEVIGVEYELEYGTDTVEIRVDAVADGDHVLLIDDLVATGGTASAALELIRKVGGTVAEACFVIDLPDLGGSAHLEALDCPVFALCAFEGH